MGPGQAPKGKGKVGAMSQRGNVAEDEASKNGMTEYEKKYTSSVAAVNLNVIDMNEFDRQHTGKAITELKCQEKDVTGMLLGVHGVPFSSVRSTKLSSNPKHLNESDSQAYHDIS